MERAGRFYDADLAAIHDEAFGDLACDAATTVLAELQAAQIPDGRVLDLGCESGILASRILAAGYAVTGLDVSAEMVELARRRAPGADLRVGSWVDAVIPPDTVAVTAVGEVVQYAADARAGLDALASLAARAATVLPAGGPIVLDVSGPGRGGPSGRYVRVHTRGEEWLLTTVVEEDVATRRLTREITTFRRAEAGSSCYRRSVERHTLTLFDPDDVASVLRAAGLEVERPAHYGTQPGASVPGDGWCVLVARRPAAGGPRAS